MTKVLSSTVCFKCTTTPQTQTKRHGQDLVDLHTPPKLWTEEVTSRGLCPQYLEMVLLLYFSAFSSLDIYETTGLNFRHY